MRDRFLRFMEGRYGVDQLYRVLLISGAILVILSNVIFPYVFLLAGWILIIWAFYRAFSRDHSRRYAENQRFLAWRSRLRSGPSRWKSEMEQRKVYHIYRCPSCRQKIRVPRGKGNIIVTCPKCRTEFRKKS